MSKFFQKRSSSSSLSHRLPYALLAIASSSLKLFHCRTNKYLIGAELLPLNAQKWICVKIECVLRVSTRLSSGMSEEEEKQKGERAIAINNCHFTDSPSPSIYLSATYTTPYLYCRSFNKNKNDRTSTIERMDSNKKNEPERKKMANSDDFFLFPQIWSLRSPSPSLIWRWLAYLLRIFSFGFTVGEVKPFGCHYVDINILITNFPFAVVPSMVAAIAYLCESEEEQTTKIKSKKFFSITRDLSLSLSFDQSTKSLFFSLLPPAPPEKLARHLSFGEEQSEHAVVCCSALQPDNNMK